MNWTVGNRTAVDYAGPTLSQTLAAEIAATPARTARTVRTVRTGVKRTVRASRESRDTALRNQIRSLQDAEPRTRHERRKRRAMIRDIQTVLDGRDSYDKA